MMMHLINPVPQIYDHNKTLPIAIQTVLDTALAKNPKDRYQTAGEFAKALQAVTTGVHKRIQLQNGVLPSAKQPGNGTTLQLQPQQQASLKNGNSITPDKLPSINGNKSSIPAESSKYQAKQSPQVAVPPQPVIQSKSPGSLSVSHQHKRRNIPVWGWLISAVVLLFVLLLAGIQWSRGGFPFNQPYSSTLDPANSFAQINPEAASSPSPQPLGQADKLAFLKDSNIWVSDLDGSNLIPLTSDDSQKSHLHWSPDGQSIIYTTANCLNIVGLQTKQVITLTCVSDVPLISAFDISPDGQNAALGFPQSDLYLLPYAQLFHMRQTSLQEDLPALAQCSYYAPYKIGDTLKAVNWSGTDNRLAVLVSKPVDGIERDKISILDFSQCNPSPPIVKEILPTHLLFTLRGYFDHPEISGLSWNGDDLLLLNSYLNNEGFGDLQLVNLEQDLSQEINPNGECCYRDIHWSPDGTYLFYTYQPESGGDISVYYAPASELGQPGGTKTALALPADFLASDIASLQPTLRTVH
jgi:hypothetical protein